MEEISGKLSNSFLKIIILILIVNFYVLCLKVIYFVRLINFGIHFGLFSGPEKLICFDYL